MSLESQIKRRNFIRVTAAYLAAAWLLIEFARIVFPGFGIPEWGVRILVILCLFGFLTIVVVYWFYELTPGGVLPETRAVQSSVKPLDVVTVFLAMAALAVHLAGQFDWDVVKVKRQSSPIVLTDVNRPTSAKYPANSIAVLPFVNMSADRGNEYFSDGVTEELLNLLARVPELRITSRSSVFSYKGKDLEISTVARELGVAHILEGSVRKNGNRVRITAQLIETDTDTQLWSDIYDRTLDDIFAIQDEIASAVVDSLKLTLLGEKPRAEKVSPEAYALFLQARYLNAQATAQAFERAIELYQQALAIAPDYASCWRGLAVTYMNQANKGLRPKNESYALARVAIDQALASDPEYAMAHATRGVLLMTHDGDMAKAAPHFSYALSLEPKNPILLSYASSLLLRLGRLDETIAIREYDVKHDPLDPIGHNNLSFAYLKAKQADKAIASIKTLLMLAPHYAGARYNMALALLLKDENLTALEAIQQEPSEVWRLIGLTMTYQALGNIADSDSALNELIEKHGQDWAYHIAMLLAHRSEADRAFKWLNRSVQLNATSLTYIAVEPLFENIHDDPRWLPFLESIGMSPQQLAAIEFNVSIPNGSPH